MPPAAPLAFVLGPTRDALPAPLVARLSSAWSPPAPPPPPRSVDLFMVLFVSVFLFLTAAILRLVPWASPIAPRHSWRDAAAPEADALRPYAPFYGALDDPAEPRPRAPAPSYETLIEIGDRIGSAKHGFTDDQIKILPTYVCRHDDAHAHSRRGLNCAICRDRYRDGQLVCVLPCSDEFHAECIAPWLRQQATCPLCRCRFA